MYKLYLLAGAAAAAVPATAVRWAPPRIQPTETVVPPRRAARRRGPPHTRRRSSRSGAVSMSSCYSRSGTVSMPEFLLKAGSRHAKNKQSDGEDLTD